MRVGFLTHLLWDRYGPFWTGLAAAAGAEVVLPAVDDVVPHLTDPRVAAAPAVAFRLAVAAALALDDVDLLVLPRLNPERDGGPGAAQDPWIADFPTMLGRARGPGPAWFAVPAGLERPVETEAVAFLSRLVHEPARVRRVWAQHHAGARPPRPPAAPPRPPGVERTVAVVGPPWLATPSLTRLAGAPGEHVVGAYTVAPAELREEGHRVDARLVDTDAEALGAVRRFARAAGVAAVRLLVDGGSGSDAWLARRAEAVAARRLEVVDVRTLGDDEARVRALLEPAT